MIMCIARDSFFLVLKQAVSCWLFPKCQICNDSVPNPLLFFLCHLFTHTTECCFYGDRPFAEIVIDTYRPLQDAFAGIGHSTRPQFACTRCRLVTLGSAAQHNLVISVHMSLQVAIDKICYFMHLQLACAHCCRLLSLRPAAHHSSSKQGCFYREWPLGPDCNWHVDDDNAGCSSWDQLLDALVAIKCDSSKNNITGLKEEGNHCKIQPLACSFLWLDCARQLKRYTRNEVQPVLFLHCLLLQNLKMR